MCNTSSGIKPHHIIHGAYDAHTRNANFLFPHSQPQCARHDVRRRCAAARHGQAARADQLHEGVRPCVLLLLARASIAALLPRGRVRRLPLAAENLPHVRDVATARTGGVGGDLRSRGDESEREEGATHLATPPRVPRRDSRVRRAARQDLRRARGRSAQLVEIGISGRTNGDAGKREMDLRATGEPPTANRRKPKFLLI